MRKAGTNFRCPFYWGVRLAEVSVKRESTVYRKSSIKLPGGLIYYMPTWRGKGWVLIETRGLFNLEKTTVSVLHEQLECKVEKLKYKKVGGHAFEDQNQIKTSSW